ncbi:hypothetical protein Tco_1156092 [Tanacetum coccineum]
MDKEDEEENGEEGGGLSQSGKELKKLLGTNNGGNESEPEQKNDADDDDDDCRNVMTFLAWKAKSILKLMLHQLKRFITYVETDIEIDIEPHYLTLHSILSATNNFSSSNELLWLGFYLKALGEVRKLFWPEQQEFFRMAAKFGATIVPLKSVNEVNYTFSKLGVSGIGNEFGKKSVHLCFVRYTENEDEMQTGISIIEGLGKHHQAEPTSGRSQYVEDATLVHEGSFLDKPKQVYTMGSVLNLHTLEAKEDLMMRQEPCPAVYPPLPALLPEWPFATEAVQEVHAASISE